MQLKNKINSSFLFSLAKTTTFVVFIYLLSFVLLLSSCKRSTAPQNDQPPVQQPVPLFNLTLQDSTCTEVWLKLRIDSTYLHKNFILKRDGKIINQFTLKQNDTLLYDQNLQPAQTYKYRAFVQDSLKILDSSNVLTATTMDTTSHDFNWQTYEFGGQGGSSSFYDVAIIEENDPSGGDSQTGIWAVGEIYTADDKYNAAHWDGEKWELKKILFHTFCDHGTLIPYPARAVFFIDNTLLISSGSEITFIKNGTQIKNQCTPVSINKIWGTSSTDLYVVGNNGLIAHYDGQNWQRIESSTVLTLTDIYGGVGNKIYIVGIDYKQYLGVVLMYDGNSCQKLIEGAVQSSGFDFDQLFKTQLYGTTEGIWVDEIGTLYTVGNLLYWYRFSKWDYVRSLPENFVGGDPYDTYRGYLHAIRGNAINDIFVFGEGNTIIHFNGISWKKLGPAYQAFSDRYWYACAVKGDLVVGVGSIHGKGRIILLRR